MRAGAQLDDRDTFLGVGTNRLVRWDQRAREGVVQDAMSSPSVVGYAGGKDYARNTNFSCMATSGPTLSPPNHNYPVFLWAPAPPVCVLGFGCTCMCISVPLLMIVK